MMGFSTKPGDWLRCVSGVAAACLLTAGASAQSGAVTGPFANSRPVVQPLPNPGADELNEALRRLSANPRDLRSLLQAGRASLELGNIDAAIGFFTRADAIVGANGAGKAGLAAAQVYKKRPVEALHLFAEAEREGAALASYAGEQGLAYDLVGDNARAQQLYRAALARGEDEEITRRLALSLAIAGDRQTSEEVLLPLLQRRDLAAYRTRAFALAVLGKTEEAVSIANVVMPASLAGRIAPYLRYMPRLTRAQQAAAGNFGHFPEAEAIGKDDPRIAALSGSAPPAAAPARGADARLIPTGEPLGNPPARPPASSTAAASAPAAAAATPRLSAAATSVTANDPQPSTNSRNPASVPTQPRPAANLAQVFSAFSLPQAGAAPAAGAVDVTRIDPPREVVKAEPPKPPKPAHPSRVWVQVATGRDRDALGFDWRRITRKAGAAMEGRSGYLAHWGETNRLLTGPFPSQKEASAFVKELNEAGIDSFTFTSAAGEAIDPLPRR